MYYYHLVLSHEWVASIYSRQQINKGVCGKFDEFLIRCNTLNTEGQAQIFFRFRVILRGDLQTKPLARGVTELKAAYTLVQDLNSLRSNYNTKSFDLKSSTFRTSSSSQFNKRSTQNPHIWMTSRTRVLNGTTKVKALSFSKLVLQPNATNVKVMNI